MRNLKYMVGDYVKYQGYICIIEEISAKGWVHLLYASTKTRVNVISDYIIDELEPILLTTEILEKNGFLLVRNEPETDSEPPYKEWRFTDGLITISFEPEVLMFEVHNGGEGSKPVRTMNYYTDGDVVFFHEFQHILRLCGLGKFADNFKMEG